MKINLPIVVVRHPKERRSKCTMQPLRWAAGFFFYNALKDFRYDATGHLVLALDAPALGPTDADWTTEERVSDEAHWQTHEWAPVAADFARYNRRPLLLLDATWRRLPQVEQCVSGNSIRRSLPRGLVTAYPRVNREGDDPDAGLATVEALYVALRLLGEDAEEVLASYRWAGAFLERNAEILQSID
jgi:pre-rRNA-processing protein TSR3